VPTLTQPNDVTQAIANFLDAQQAQPPMPSPGSVILLNGPSSSGKTTLARAAQQQFDIPFLRFSFDLFLDHQALPMDAIRRGAFTWASIRPQVFAGVHQCLPALAAAGNNVIFDYIIETQAALDHLAQVLAGFDVFLVGLHCSLPELERREQERGNRRNGEAALDVQTVHTFTAYDLELNSEHPVKDNATRLIEAWYKRQRPSVFDKLGQQ
jgi:chloramphenicol 3-O phosphotransferase